MTIDLTTDGSKLWIEVERVIDCTSAHPQPACPSHNFTETLMIDLKMPIRYSYRDLHPIHETHKKDFINGKFPGSSA